jgi:flagellar biosynthetic protein FlhB
MAESRASRTEKPTGRRLDKARREGNVPRSQEVSQVLVLVAFLLFCHLFGGAWLARLEGLIAGVLSGIDVGDMTPTQWIAAMTGIGWSAALLLFAPVGMMSAASLSGHLLQGTPPFSFEPLRPKLSRVDPVKGIRKVFSLRSLVNLLKAMIKLALFTTVALMAVRDAIRDGLVGAPGAEGATLVLFTLTGKVIFRIIVIWIALAILDLLYTRFQHTRDLMMTKQEVKDERRQTEGDPRVKARIRSKQIEMARSRMMADLPNATVVITNPTHYAVALRYVPGETDVPRLLAKGRDLLAQKIREVAAEHRIPIVEDPPLARSIYRSVPLGGPIPEKLYRAVAEILAMVLRRKRGRRTAESAETR